MKPTASDSSTIDRRICGSVLAPLRGVVFSLSVPRACALGYILSPLRGWTHSKVCRVCDLRFLLSDLHGIAASNMLGF